MIQASSTETALVPRLQPTIPLADQRLILELALNYARHWETQRQRSDMMKRKANSRTGREFWIPRVDIFDDPDSQYIVGVFEVPGVGREDASINVVDGKLIIEGKRRTRFKRYSQTSGGWHEENGSPDCTSQVQRPLTELRYGKFRRELVLPAGVDSTHVRVLLEHGTLHVQWPRSAPKSGIKRRITDDSGSSSKRRKSTDTA